MDCFVTLITNIVAAITKHACGCHKYVYINKIQL